MRKLLHLLSLFGSAGTLVCCALPALLVALGMGATMAGLASSVPQIIWLSEKKHVLFPVSAALLALAGWLQWRARALACPIDGDKAAACASARDWGFWVYCVSVGLFLIGAFFAYAAPLLFF